MINNPIDTNSFTHFLRFISLGKMDLYRISEPVGFDAAEFSMKQNTARFSRDNFYMADDQKTFTFQDGQFERVDFEQVQDPQGYRSKYLDHGLKWILETRKRFGPSGKIEYILKKDEVEFTTGIFGTAKADTDGYSYFSCNIIQDENQSAYSKHADTKINVLGDKNVKNESITPVETFKFLRKSIPIIANSKLETTDDFSSTPREYFFGSRLYYQPAIQLTAFGVETTFSPSELETFVNSSDTNSVYDAIDRRLLFQAKRRTENIKIKISDINWKVVTKRSLSFPTSPYENSVVSYLSIAWGNSSNDSQKVDYFTNYNPDVVNENIEFEIPILEIGQKIWFYFTSQSEVHQNAHSVVEAFISKSLTITIDAITRSLNTVIEGVRYVDMKKQCSKFIRNKPVNAPKFDIGGVFYDQVCYNRALIGQNKKLPFITTFKETLGSVEEVCADYEINKDEIFVGQYEDFYTNDEIGVFLIIPSKNYKEPWNERFMINRFNFGYKTFEQNRDTQNTKQDVHTESEWIIPDDMAQNKKEIKCEFVRSGFSQQVAVDLEINKPMTSDDNDDKVYIQDIIPLPANSFGEFGAILANKWGDSMLQIMNKSISGDTQDSTINWLLLGIKINEDLFITDGKNIGTYKVKQMTAAVLTLQPIGTIVQVSGDHYVKLKWFYNDIQFTTRTDEGFNIIDGITIKQYFSNLLYTIRRNMVHWESYLNTACFFQKSKEIVCNYFKNDVPLKTQFENGPIYIENAPIDIDTLNAPILTPKTMVLECVAEFTQIVELLEKYKTKRGFIRCYDMNGKVIKGYIQDLAQTWRTNNFKLTLEEKYEEENLILTFLNGVLTVNDVYYDLIGMTEWWKVTGDYFAAYDDKSRPICNLYHYSFVELNGIKYNSVEELVNALSKLEI